MHEHKSMIFFNIKQKCQLTRELSLTKSRYQYHRCHPRYYTGSWF